MQIETEGILINIKPFSEKDAIAHIFTKNNGILVGMLRGAISARKNKPLIGQFGNVAWNARLDSQLGVFHWEAQKNLVAPLMINMDLLKLVNSAFALIYTLIPERESYEVLYNNTLQLLQDMASSCTPYDLYLKWETVLLGELGYALDLTKCSGCQKTDSLCYLSPRTGRAVCKDCGEPYKDKLYKLPLNLEITGRFVRAVCDAQGVDMPVARTLIK